MNTRTLWLLIAVAPLVASCSTAGFRRGEPVGRPVVIQTDAQARGQIVYMRHCYHCHQGGEGGLAPALNLPLPGVAIRTQVRVGVGAMPAFTKAEISDQDLDDLIDYMKLQRRS